MFFDSDIKGNRLPPKTICLTYDDGPGRTEGDGPGPHTTELGQYLFGHGIQATFFVVGSQAERHEDILGRLKAWGHLIGNHTYSHPGLVALAERGGDVIGEIARTDDIIRRSVPAGVVFFRPPYGNWRQKQAPDSSEDKPTSVVADILNRSGKFQDHVGPVNWDISAADYDSWRRGASAEECAKGYLDKIDRIGKGIVLMHDSSEEEAVRVKNRTLEMTKLIVPILKERGYRFVRLDSIPQVRSALRVAYQVALRTPQNRFLARRAGSDEVTVQGPSEGAREAFGVVKLGGNKVALRASNGHYLSPQRGGGGEVLANAPSVGGWESLEMEDSGGNQVAFRTARGYYLTRERGGGRLLANGARRGDSETFVLHPLFGASCSAKDPETDRHG